MKTFLRNNKALLLFLCAFGIFRTAMADWNPIPSGSMQPTLLEGDVVFVDRLAYDLKLPLTNLVLAHLGEPQRGDIVTFYSPADNARLIKRIVGLPGDRIEMRDEKILVNGQALAYAPIGSTRQRVDKQMVLEALLVRESGALPAHQIQLLPGVQARRDFGPLVVAADHYFMLGDNRDNSADSRYIGQVPRAQLIGRANHILVSAAILDDWMPRPARFWQALH